MIVVIIMAGYNPPKDVPHCEISAFSSKFDNVKLIGHQGSNLKRITDMLNLKYVWVDLTRNIIEIYASTPAKLEKSKKYFDKYLQKFYDKHCKTDFEPVSKKRKVI